MKHELLSCKHCDKPAVWKWEDADGNESALICGRCMETVWKYRAAPIWQFEQVNATDIRAEAH